MLRVAMQVLTQLGVIVGALVAGISSRISSVETIAPGVLSDVGVFGVCAAGLCGLVLVVLATFEAAATTRSERRLADIHGQIQKFLRPASTPMSALRSQAAQAPSEVDLPAKDAAQILKLIAELPEEEQQKIVEVLGQSKVAPNLSTAAVAALLGSAIGLFPATGGSGLIANPFSGFTPDTSMRLRLQPTPSQSGFWRRFFRTVFVPFSVRRNS